MISAARDNIVSFTTWDEITYYIIYIYSPPSEPIIKSIADLDAYINSNRTSNLMIMDIFNAKSELSGTNKL